MMKRIVIACSRWYAASPLRRRARAEEQLDRTEAQVRQTILAIADELAKAGFEARKEMIRQAYLESGRTPQQH